MGTTTVYCGDSRESLTLLHGDSVDLIVTSPPYADQRSKTYGGVPAEKYVDWFMPIADQLLLVLKPTGTFILNIKEKVVEGERSPYVLELILRMREHGWLWTEEFIWCKKNCTPGKWPSPEIPADNPRLSADYQGFQSLNSRRPAVPVISVSRFGRPEALWLEYRP